MKKFFLIILGLIITLQSSIAAYAADISEYRDAYENTANTKKAEFILRKALKEYPQDTFFLREKIDTYLETGAYDQALDILRSNVFADTQKDLLEATIYHKKYLQEKNQGDFYQAQNAYEKILAYDYNNREVYEKLIELLLSAPKGLSVSNTFYRSNYYDIELNYEPEREYRTQRAYPRYDAYAYRFVENPLYEIDVLVNKADKIFRNDPIKYDKAWLSDKYVQLAEAILATRPDNPSMELDRALILADRALDINRSSIAAKSLRNTFRARHR